MFKIRISKRWLENTAIIFLFLFFASVNAFWGYDAFLNSNIVPVMASGIPLTMFLVMFLHRRIKVNSKVLLLALLIYCIIVFYSRFNIKLMLYYGVCLSVLLYSKSWETENKLRIFLILSIIFAFGTLFDFLFQKEYRSLILPYFRVSTQYSRIQNWSISGIAYPGFMNQTAYNAGFLVYGIGYLICSLSIYKKNRSTIYILLFILLVCLLLTNKRAHFLFLFGSLISVYYFSGKRSKRITRLIKIAVLVICLFIAIGILSNYFEFGVLSKLSQTLQLLSAGGDISSGRIPMYKRALELFFNHPLFGIGWGKFQQTQEFKMSVHNVYLQLLCETGLIGFAAFVIFFTFSFRMAMKVSKLCFISKEDELTARFCLFLQSFFLLYCFTGNPLYDVAFYVPYFLGCSYTYSLYYKYMPVKNEFIQ